MKDEKALTKQESKVSQGPSSGSLDRFFGFDGTSVTVITHVMDEDKGEILRGTEIYRQAEDFINNESKTKGREDAEARLGRASDLLENFNKSFNASSSTVEAVRTKYAIMMGKILLRMKVLAKAAGRLFGDYASQNLSFIQERTRQRYMRLASRPDAYKYAIVGIERLLFLINETQEDIKKNTSRDPIGDLFEKHGLTFNPEGGEEIEDFQGEVNVAIAMAKLERRGITVDRVSVEDFLEDGGKVDLKIMKELAMVQASGGKADEHLANVMIGTPNERDEEETGRIQKVESLNKLSVKTASTLSYVATHTDLISRVNVANLGSLHEALYSVNALMMPTPEHSEDLGTDRDLPEDLSVGSESATERDSSEEEPGQ